MPGGRIKRERCRVPGCNNLQARKHGNFPDSRPRFRSVCQDHLRKKDFVGNPPPSGNYARKQLRKPACELCGYNKAPCDIHRIVPGAKGGKYVEDNVITLCPNCHREVTIGVTDIPSNLLMSILKI